MRMTALTAALAAAFSLTAWSGAQASDPATQTPVTQPNSPPEQAADPARNSPARHPSVTDVRLSQLMGLPVRNSQGENLGAIHDLVIDLDADKVQYAVVGFGGMLGLGEKLFAFPMSTFKASHEPSRAAAAGGRVDKDGVQSDRGPIGSDKPDAAAQQAREDTRRSEILARNTATRDVGSLHLVLDIDPSSLKGAPGFDRNRWPD